MCYGVGNCSENLKVYTHFGYVRGGQSVLNGKDVDVFWGIPYATPPTGNLRFERPVPPAPWNGTYSATNRPRPCVQLIIKVFEASTRSASGYSEDCLYLNVWRPSGTCSTSLKCAARLPVVVFIHGGAFQWGNSALPAYDGSNLVATSDVVFVSFNYRVGIFGFLSVDSSELSGNMGLWDQNLALKWVNANINFFGGDASDVTLWGHSAGAASAGFHAISSRSKGLFRRVILQSGTPLVEILSVSYSRITRFLGISNAVGCYDRTRNWKSQISDTISCLKRANTSIIVDKINEDEPINRLYSPIHGDDFLPDDPLREDTWRDVNVKEIFTGHTFNEGTLAVHYLRKVFPQVDGIYDKDYRFVMTLILTVTLAVPLSEGKKIIQAYFGDYDVHHNNDTVFSIMADLVGDVVFACPTDLLAQTTADQGIDTYKYVFAHRPSFTELPDNIGVGHSEDVPFMLGSLDILLNNSASSNETTKKENPSSSFKKHLPEEAAFSRQLLEMVSSFIKRG